MKSAYSVLRIELQDPRVVFDGDLVEGVVVVACSEPFTVKELSLVFSGDLEYEWQQRVGYDRRYIKFADKLASYSLSLFASNTKVQLNPGETRFPFSFKLPKVSVPSALLTDLASVELGTVRYFFVGIFRFVFVFLLASSSVGRWLARRVRDGTADSSKGADEVWSGPKQRRFCARSDRSCSWLGFGGQIRRRSFERLVFCHHAHRIR